MENHRVIPEEPNKAQFIVRNRHRKCRRPVIQLSIKSPPRSHGNNHVSFARSLLQHRGNQNLIAYHELIIDPFVPLMGKYIF